MADADAVTQLLISARRTTEQALLIAHTTGDTTGTAEAQTASAALSDAADKRIARPRAVAA